MFIMAAQCANCGTPFSVDTEFRAFLARVAPVIGGKTFAIPDPTHCVNCRQQRRMALRDERFLYKRTSDFSGRALVSSYSPDKPYKIYENDIWWSDKWDATEYGRDFDFSRPFFEQFRELSIAVPKMQYTGYNNENCPFVNRCSNCRNCYMSFNVDHGEDCYYCEVGYKTKTCVDCGFSKEMECCIECVDCFGCYGCIGLDSCSHLTESAYCFDCHNCQNILFCWNLRGKKFCIGNVQYTPEEYQKRRDALHLDGFNEASRNERKFQEVRRARAIHRYANLINCEGCTGDHVFQSRECHNCYDVLRGENLRNVFAVDNNAKDSMDCAIIWDGAELNYECMSTNRYHILFSYNVWESSEVLYSELCMGSGSLFGCSGLRHKKYCVLNKEYVQEEYEQLVPRIIEHMQRTGEWGEFFPVSISPLAYNESLTMEYFPMKREDVTARGWRWKDDLPGTTGKETISWAQVPDSIAQAPATITNEILSCSVCHGNFRIIPQELVIRKDMHVPLPRTCPDCRHKGRLARRNPRHLWQRTCMKCGKPIETTYAPDRPELVYCEECYLQQVY